MKDFMRQNLTNSYQALKAHKEDYISCLNMAR